MIPWLSTKGDPTTDVNPNCFKDYISPTGPEIWWCSIRNKDIAVAASITIVNLVTLVIVISTALFALEPNLICYDQIPYSLTSRWKDGDPSSVLSASAVHFIVYDALNTLGLPFPAGLTPELAYQSFEPRDRLGIRDPLQNVTVDAITADLSCVPAVLQNSIFAQFDEDDCTTAQFKVRVPNCTIVLGGPQTLGYEVCGRGPSTYFTFFDYGVCEEDPSNSHGWQIIFGIVYFQKPSTNRNLEVVESRQWICGTLMQSVRTKIVFNGTDSASGGIPNVIIDKTELTQSNLSESTMSSLALVLTWAYALDVPGTPTVQLAGQPFRTNNVNTFSRIFRSAPKNTTLDDVFKSDALLTLIKSFYKEMSAISAYYTLRDLDHDIVNGTICDNEDRLVIRALPLRLIEVCLVIVILLMLYLCSSISRSPLSADPSCLAGLIVVIRDKEKIRRCFSGKGQVNVTSLRAGFGNCDKGTSIPSRDQYAIDDLNERSFLPKASYEADQETAHKDTLDHIMH